MNANIGVYNDVKDFGKRACLYWEDDDVVDKVQGPNGKVVEIKRRLPVIELVFDKSKLFKGYDGVIYYKLTPESGRYDECSLEEQQTYEDMACQPHEGVYEEGRGSPGKRYRGSGRPVQMPAPVVNYPTVAAAFVAARLSQDEWQLDLKNGKFVKKTAAPAEVKK